jgi:ABC-type arginine transport system ATPase subunit
MSVLSNVLLWQGSYALVFPGQGSQFVGMAKALMADPVALAVFEEADSVLDEPITPLMCDGPEVCARAACRGRCWVGA